MVSGSARRAVVLPGLGTQRFSLAPSIGTGTCSGVKQSDYELVALKSGQRSVRSRTHGETMHVGTGPRTEALELHVRQQRLVERIAKHRNNRPFVLWDVGLGPGGNALVVLDSLRGIATPVEIHSFDRSREVIAFALRHAAELEYMAGWESAVTALLADGVAFPNPNIRWQFHCGEFRELLHNAPPPTAILFDPYSPARNPEMWSLEIFRAMRARVGEETGLDCVMTNYTRSTAARVTMALAGWFVGTGVAIGEKDQTTIAATRRELLECPLDSKWLLRVRASTNAAPFRNGLYTRSPISAEEFDILQALEQFGVM